MILLVIVNKFVIYSDETKAKRWIKLGFLNEMVIMEGCEVVVFLLLTICGILVFIFIKPLFV